MFEGQKCCIFQDLLRGIRICCRMCRRGATCGLEAFLSCLVAIGQDGQADRDVGVSELAAAARHVLRNLSLAFEQVVTYQWHALSLTQVNYHHIPSYDATLCYTRRCCRTLFLPDYFILIFQNPIVLAYKTHYCIAVLYMSLSEGSRLFMASLPTKGTAMTRRLKGVFSSASSSCLLLSRP